MLKMKKIEKEKKRKEIRAYFQRSMGYLFWRQVCLSVHTPGVLFYTSHIDVSRKENQALCNEIEELKNKLQKVTDDLSKINMADTPNGPGKAHSIEFLSSQYGDFIRFKVEAER